MATIHNQWWKIVVFLCVEVQGDDGSAIHEPRASGFFVRTPETDTHKSADYLVTARHCIEEARQEKTLFIRFNLKDGGSTEIPTSVDDWVMHSTADVAAVFADREGLSPGIERDDLDTASIEIGVFAGPPPDYRYQATIEPYGDKTYIPQVGDEVYFLGLFTETYGDNHNLPVARFGSIARMPSEVRVQRGQLESTINAYLVDFYSMGGNSGAPVFFNWPILTNINRVNDAGAVTRVETNLMYHSALLGLVSGHYNVPAISTNPDGSVSDIRVKQNSGIALVTPANAIVELLDDPDLRVQRAKGTA